MCYNYLTGFNLSFKLEEQQVAKRKCLQTVTLHYTVTKAKVRLPSAAVIRVYLAGPRRECG